MGLAELRAAIEGDKVDPRGLSGLIVGDEARGLAAMRKDFGDEPTAPQPPGFLARIKQHLTAEPPAGARTMFGETDMPGRVVRAIGDYVLPGSWLEAGATAGSMVAPPLAALRGVPQAIRAAAAARPGVARVVGGAVGGEAGNLAEGGTPGVGLALGGGGTALGEGIGWGVGRGLAALPGMKRLISREDTARVGKTMEDMDLARGIREPEDVLAATTAAVGRQRAGERANDAALVAHKEAVSEAKRRAQEATEAGRADRRTEWQRRRSEWQQGAQQAREDARTATERARAETEAAQQRTLGTVREEQAEGVRSLIGRETPQLGPALEGPSASEALRGAGSGGAKRVLRDLKEQYAQELERAVPGGRIRVPSLAQFDQETGQMIPGSDMIPVRDALESLSFKGFGGTQFGRLPQDRDIRGAGARLDYGRRAEELRRGFDEAREGLGAIFQRGQDLYRQGLGVNFGVLRPSTSYLPTGEVNIPSMHRQLLMPKGREALEMRLGPERTGRIVEGIGGLRREVPAHAVPAIEPVLPPKPAVPLRVAPVHPDIPPRPQPFTPTPGDEVLRELFGRQTDYLLDPKGGVINWPGVAKHAQAPETLARLVEILGPDRADRLIRSMLRGAKFGADRPVVGTGRLGGALADVAAGRGQGATFGAVAPVRALLPNIGAGYVGRHPGSVPDPLQMILDLAAQRALMGVAQETR